MLLDKTGRRSPTNGGSGDDEPRPTARRLPSRSAREKEHNALKGARRQAGLAPPQHREPGCAQRRGAPLRPDRAGIPAFNDGRAYSQARLLRSRFGYQGVRATGNVLRDQLLFMRRAGFDGFEVDGAGALAEDWAKAFGEFDVLYRPA